MVGAFQSGCGLGSFGILFQRDVVSLAGRFMFDRFSARGRPAGFGIFAKIGVAFFMVFSLGQNVELSKWCNFPMRVQI